MRRIILFWFLILTFGVQAQSLDFEDSSDISDFDVFLGTIIGVDLVPSPCQNAGNYMLRFNHPSSYMLFGPTTVNLGLSFIGNISIGNPNSSATRELLFYYGPDSNFSSSSNYLSGIISNYSCDSIPVGTIPIGSYIKIQRQAGNINDAVLMDKLTLTSGVVPVELTSFSGYRNGRFVYLHWRTATELNNFGFSIEKFEGVWKEVGFVLGHGTSNSPNKYTWGSEDLSSHSLYRLKQIDRDGKISYSQVVELENNFDRIISIYPSTLLSGSVLNIHISMKVTTPIYITLYDGMGKEVMNIFKQDVQEVHIAELLPYSAGVYYLRVHTPEGVDIFKTQTIVIL